VAGGATNRYGETTFSYPGGQVSYGSKQHTNELVTIYALGAGRDLFKNYEGKWYPGTRIMDNTHIHAVVQAATGLN
jgi:alkaline phosphatase